MCQSCAGTEYPRLARQWGRTISPINWLHERLFLAAPLVLPWARKTTPQNFFRVLTLSDVKCTACRIYGKAKLNPARPPGQLLGYSLQVTEYLRQLLIASSGTTVSVEVFEDVGLASASDQKTALQTKSSLTGNPIADRAIDFWKTLCNWIKAIKAGQLTLDGTVFRIYVLVPKSGTIADSFAAAETDMAAEQRLQQLRMSCGVRRPSFLKRQTLLNHCDHTLKRFSRREKTTQVQIVKHFTLSFGSGVSRLDLEQLLAKKLAPEEMLDHVLDKCLGWVKSQVDSALEKQQPAAITVDTFNREIGAFIRKTPATRGHYDGGGEVDFALYALGQRGRLARVSLSFTGHYRCCLPERDI